jgi:hypothetical protein
MEAICSSETSVATQQTTRRHIQEDDTLHNHRCENLKSYKVPTYLVLPYIHLTTATVHTLYNESYIHTAKTLNGIISWNSYITK